MPAGMVAQRRQCARKKASNRGESCSFPPSRDKLPRAANRPSLPATLFLCRARRPFSFCSRTSCGGRRTIYPTTYSVVLDLWMLAANFGQRQHCNRCVRGVRYAVSRSVDPINTFPQVTNEVIKAIRSCFQRDHQRCLVTAARLSARGTRQSRGQSAVLIRMTRATTCFKR